MVTEDAAWPDWLPSTDNSVPDSHVPGGTGQDSSDFSREIAGLCKAQPDGGCNNLDVRTPVLNKPGLTAPTPSKLRSSQTPRRSSLFQTNVEFEDIPTPPQSLRSLAPQNQSGVLSPLSSSWAGLQEPKTLSYPEPRKDPPHSSVSPAKPHRNEELWLERLKILGNAIESYKRHSELRRDLQRSHNAIVSDGFVTFSDHTKDRIIKSTNTLNLKACEENTRLEGYLNELITPTMWMHPSEPLPAQEHIMAIRDTSDTRKELAEVKAAVGYLASALNLSGPPLADDDANDRMQSPEDGEIPPSFTSLPGLEVPEPKVKPTDLESIRARADRHSEQLTTIEGILAERGPPPDLQTLWEAEGAECMRTSGLDATVQNLEEQVASYRAQLDAATAERAALREANTELKTMLDGLMQKQRHGQEAIDKAQTMLKDLNEKLAVLSNPCHCGGETHIQFVHSLVQEVVRRTLTSMMAATMGELDQMIKESEVKTLTTAITSTVNLQQLTNDLISELRTEPKIDFTDFKL